MRLPQLSHCWHTRYRKSRCSLSLSTCDSEGWWRGRTTSLRTHLISFTPPRKCAGFALAASKGPTRHLEARPRVVSAMPAQSADPIEAYLDTDWTGCLPACKATSGGCVFIGPCATKCWSATKASLALSRGEAENYGVVRAARIGSRHSALSNEHMTRFPTKDALSIRRTNLRDDLTRSGPFTQQSLQRRASMVFDTPWNGWAFSGADCHPR